MKIIIPVEIFTNIYKHLESQGLSDKMFAKQLDRCVWLTYHLYELKTYKTHSLMEFTPMNSKKLEGVLGSKQKSVVLKVLIDNNIISINNKYSAGRFSKSFRFTDHFDNSGIHVHELSYKNLLDKIQNKQKVEDDREYVKRYYNEVLLNYSIDQKAIDFLLNLKKQRGLTNQTIIERHIQINNILKRNIYLKTDKYGRLYHNFNNLKKDFRSFIVKSGISDHLNLVEVDISSCQAFILSSILISEYKDQPVPEDLQRYHNFTMSEDFYTEIYNYIKFRELREGEPMTDFDFEDFDRKNFKKSVISIFNRKTSYNNSNNNTDKQLYVLLKSYFPTVYSMVDTINELDNKQIHSLIMKAETKVMVDMLISNIVQLKIPGFTIHDAVLIERKYLQPITSIIKGGFYTTLGYIPNVKQSPI